MSAVLLTAPGTADAGDTWTGWLLTLDLDGFGTTPGSVVGTVTRPDTSTAAITATAHATTGLYGLSFAVPEEGTYAAVVTVTDAVNGNDVVTWTVQARATTGEPPTLDDVVAYLGDDSSWSEEDVQDAYDAELAAQARRCRIPVDWPADLGQALKRRVARNLAARAIPVATFTSFEGATTSARVPMLDAEIERFETPFRKLVVA